MSREDDIRRIIVQETELVFGSFDEAVAFSLGTRLRDRAIQDGLSIVADIRTWDRPLFYMALPGTTGDNQHWVRRKFNLVQRVTKSSYRVVLENKTDVDYFLPRRGLDNADFVLAGGGFPIKVRGAGMIGCLTISGLHERDDHRLAVDAICDELGIERSRYALPSL